MSLDKQAVKILVGTFWSSTGWRRDPRVEPEDLAYAKSKGIMFDPVSLSHSEAVKAVNDVVVKIDPSDVASAFISSLSNRRLDLRSALGSFAVGRYLREHAMMNGQTNEACSYCGEYEFGEHDLNILNFERIKWGGVRHDQPNYIAFDLGVFSTLKLPSPQPQDFNILQAILNVVRGMPANARPNQLEKALTGVFPSNRSERRTLVEILGFAGILVDPSRPDFRSNFVPNNERERTPWHTDDWSYPVQCWNGGYGISENALAEWFPTVVH
jgi:hypothetical protein